MSRPIRLGSAADPTQRDAPATEPLPGLQANPLDRAIAWVSPGWAMRRLRHRAYLMLSGAYHGARMDRDSGRLWTPSAGSADADLTPDLDMLRRRARDLDRNDPIARGALNTARTAVIGPGLKPIPMIDGDYLGLTSDAAAEWERQAAREWTLFADNIECDISRSDTFFGLQALAYRSARLNGDVFAYLRMKARKGSPYALKLQLFEADQIADPPRAELDRLGIARDVRITGGIEQDSDGAPVAVWIQSRHPGAVAPYQLRSARIAWSRVPVFGAESGRRNILHVMMRNRIGQTRGEPWLAPVIETLKQISRYTHAEIMAAVVNACFAVTTKTQGGVGASLTELDGMTDEGGRKINLTQPATIVDLDIDEEIQSFTPGRPNATFDPFMLAMLRHIGAGLGIPVEILIKHFTASYSASRAALLEAWRFYQDERKWIEADFCQPVYEAWLTEAVARSRLAAPGFLEDPIAMRAWSRCMWIGPAPGHIQPKQEADAAATRMESGITTLAEEIAQYNGGNWESKHRQQVKEHDARRRDGLLSNGAAAPPAAGPPILPEPDPDTDDQELET